MNLFSLFESELNEDYASIGIGGGADIGGSGAAASGDTSPENNTSPIGSGAGDMEEDITEHNTLDEVAMNPSAFAKSIANAQDQGVLVGFEFETLIPSSSVKHWKTGDTTVGYDASSTAWIDGKTTDDLLDGISRVGNNNWERILLDLFKYKTSVKTATGFKNVEDHYQSWARNRIEAELSDKYEKIVLDALSALFKDPVAKNENVMFMNGNAEDRYGSEQLTGVGFALIVLKEKTGIDFSKKVKKSELTDEVLKQIREAMHYCYQVTRGPIDQKYLAVRNAFDHAKANLAIEYTPSIHNFRDGLTPYQVAAFKQHFAEFCRETMGTNNLKELLLKKWAFNGRVNNVTDTLKEKLWYYLTPGADTPASLRPRSRSSSYTDGAEFLKANLKDSFGENIRIFTGYHQETKLLDRWYIEPDGSLSPNPGDYSAEVVSPPLRAGDAMAALRTFYEKARQMNLYTNSSTGLHINVSIPGNLDVLKLATFIGDSHVLKQFGRENNRYARSVIQSLRSQGNLPTVGSSEFKDAEKEMKALVQRISGDHFATVNFNGKYVSFRHAGGDYLNKMTDIANTVGRFVRAMMIAADPEAYRAEYVNKLLKMMKDPGSTDSVSFSDIRKVTSKGIPVRVVDILLRPNYTAAALESWAKVWPNGGNAVLTPDPSARARLLADRGFGSETKQWMQSAPDTMFYRATVYPSSRNSLNNYAEIYSDIGTTRGQAFGIYSAGDRERVAVGVANYAAISPTDPGYMEAIKMMRGGKAKTLPLPGKKQVSQAPSVSPAASTTQQASSERGNYEFVSDDGRVAMPFNTLADAQRRAQEFADSANHNIAMITPQDHHILVRPQETRTDEADFAGLQYGIAEDNSLSGALSDGSGVSATLGTDNDLSPIGSGTNEAGIHFWNSLDENLDMEEKMSICEKWAKGKLNESPDSQDLEYFRGLKQYSVNPIVGHTYIVVPLLLTNVITSWATPEKCEYLGYKNKIQTVKNAHGKVKQYPHEPIRESSSFICFFFNTQKQYDRFRSAVSIKFDTRLPEIAEDQYGGGFGGGSIAPVTDSTSPVGGGGASVEEGRENFNGINLLLQKDDDELFVKASAGGRELGHVLFAIDGEYLIPQDLEVDERYRGQGIATTMYDYVKSKGYKIRRSSHQTDAGAGFWDRYKPGQIVWEQGVTEGHDDFKSSHQNAVAQAKAEHGEPERHEYKFDNMSGRHGAHNSYLHYPDKKVTVNTQMFKHGPAHNVFVNRSKQGVAEGYRHSKAPWVKVIVRTDHDYDPEQVRKLPLEYRAQGWGNDGEGQLIAFASKKDASYFILKQGGEVVKTFPNSAGEQGVAEGHDDDETPYDDKYQSMVQRVGQKAREQEKRRPVDLDKLAQRLRQADSERGIEIDETIRKIGDKYRLVSHTGKNLGTYPSKAGAEKRERQVNYFKHQDSMSEDEIMESWLNWMKNDGYDIL